MRNIHVVGIGLCMLLLALPAVPADPPASFNGVSSYSPASAWDAPVFRQFAFVEDIVTQYHVLTPETFLTDNHKSRIYQFPSCLTLQPVLQKHEPVPGEGYWDAHDAPTREIVDVVLATGCAVQPRSEAEVLAGAVAVVPRDLWVNAPVIPAQLADLPDDRLFNGPPYRPRVTAWMDGAPVKFITYEASWVPTWVGANFPAQDADVFMISYGAMFRPGFTILNVASGTPMSDSVSSYSPIWVANCIVDAVDQKCMLSVNLQVPGYYQCRSVAECLSMVNSNTGYKVQQMRANTFTHINCPMVAVDLDGDDYIAAHEELVFPDLWVNGPVTVV